MGHWHPLGGGCSGELGLLTGGQTRTAWPRSQLTPGGRASQNRIDLVSGQQGGVYMLLLTQGWPACLDLQSISAPHLSWLHPRGTVFDNFLHFGARLWSHLPESSFCWSWSVLRVYSYCPQSIPGRWFISTLADLCVLTFWLCQIPGPVSYLRWRIWQLNSAYVHRNIQATTAPGRSCPKLRGAVLACIGTRYFARQMVPVLFFLIVWLFSVLLKGLLA